MFKRMADFFNTPASPVWGWRKRQMKAAQYRAVALSGGGKRECARRLRQIAAGSLRAENGLAV